MIRTGLGVALLAACTAQPPARAPIAAPSLDLPGLAFYVGTWTCDGTQLDASGTATSHDALEVRVTPDIDHWLHINVLEDGKAVTSELKGFDPATKTFHHIWTASDGTSGSLTSTGWTGNTLAFTEDHPAPAQRTRMTMTMLDADHFTHDAEVDTGAGYHHDYLKRCTRKR